MTTATAQSKISTEMRLLVILALGLSLVQFVIRGPIHPSYYMWDFAVFYSSARAWVAGENPYARGAMADVWQAAGGRANIMDGLVEEDFAKASPNLKNPKPWLATQFIPAALPVVAPFALLPAVPAQVAWSTVVYLLIIAQLLAVVRLMHWPVLSYQTGLLTATMLILEPLHLGVAVGQPSTPSISFILIALALVRDVSAGAMARIVAGVLLAFAAALKPQLAFPFIAYLSWRRNWLATGVALACFGMLWFGATMPMSARGLDWLEAWRLNLVWAQTNGIDTVTRTNPDRHAMLNLQVFLHGMTFNRVVVNSASLAIVAALACLTVGLRSCVPKRNPEREQLALALVAVLTVLPVYHRYYDAVLLLLPIAWAINGLLRDRTSPSRFAGVSLLAVLVFGVCLVVFASPYYWVERVFKLHEHAPLRQSWWWTFAIVPHRCIALLAVAAFLLVSLDRLRQATSRGLPIKAESHDDDHADAHPLARAA